MVMFSHVRDKRLLHLARGVVTTILVTAIFITPVLLTANTPAMAGQALPENQGLFLVATEQLEGTSFQEAVILITHHSKRGATGLTINRPSNIPLKDLFPHTPQLRQRKDPLYLGGPVKTNAIFVLLRTDRPGKRMHHIAKDVYFSTAQHAYNRTPNISSLANESRTYGGYAGWAAGQLQSEIERGDWLLIHHSPEIIFEKSPSNIWTRLSKSWSGQWL